MCSNAALCRGDFKFYEWDLVLTVRQSKMIQFRERVFEVPIARCCDRDMCAVY